MVMARFSPFESTAAAGRFDGVLMKSSEFFLAVPVNEIWGDPDETIGEELLAGESA